MGAVRRHTGLTDILEWVGQASGIDDDVFTSFSEGDAAKILSIARYWIGSGGNTLPRLESWQVMHSLPYGTPALFQLLFHLPSTFLSDKKINRAAEEDKAEGRK